MLAQELLEEREEERRCRVAASGWVAAWEAAVISQLRDAMVSPRVPIRSRSEWSGLV